LLTIVLKKLLKNKWMTLCMLTGSILIIALLSGIPIYAQGVLQRVLIKDMEKLQTTSSVYPGTIKVTTTYGTSRTDSKITKINENVEKTLNSIEEKYGLGVISRTQVVSSPTLLAYTDIDANAFADTNGVSLTKKGGIEDHVKMVYGRMYQPRDDGVIEVIMTQEALVNSKLLMGTQYTLAESRYLRIDETDPKPVIEVVGVFTLEDENDTFWSEGFTGYKSTVFCSTEDFDAFAAQDLVFTTRSAQWYLLLDYYGIKLHNIEFLNDAFKADSNHMYNCDVSWVVMDALDGFAEKQAQLSFTLLVLELPVLILLAFYIFMVSQLVIDNEANEIAVLKSRGASKMHIFCIYLLEGAVISAFAMLVGPPLGLFMCYCLGGANGFLEFVNRSALEVRLSGTAYFYAFIAALFFILMMLIPAIRASRQTILTHKQQVARASNKKPVWQRFFLDFVLIAISVYGLYSYNNQKELMQNISLGSSDSTVDPLMLLISTIFILGVGLLFLRLYPYLIKLIFLIGRKFWTPTFYLSLTQVSRSHGGEQFLMLFLVFTVGVSIFSANTARTINVNQEENLTYLDGADIVIQNEWNRDLAYYNAETVGGYKVYKEISYLDYKELETVEQATRVWKGSCVGLWSTNYIRVAPEEGIGLMTIDPSEFAETAQMRNGLTEYHWYNYCNLLTDYSNVILMSSEFKQFGIQVGDSMQLMLADDCMRTVVVGSFIDYWPGMNVNDTTGIGNTAGQKSNFFIVTTFDVVFQDTFDIPLQPYEIWLKKAEGCTSNDVYTEIGEKNLRVDARKDLTEDTINLKNDPTLQSMNGALTLCFIISLVICFAGFLIYWIISISRRILQFGIVRAIGMKTSSLIGMLLIEQVLISGASIIAGIFIGVLTSYYFIPIYSMTQSASSLMLPFRIVSMDIDYIRLYCILAAILVIGFAILAILIKKIKINNALKIGED